MTRFFAILGAIFCIGMIFPMAVTETVRGEADSQRVMIHNLCKLTLTTSFLVYCGFAAAHAVYHVDEPKERVRWLLLTLGFNVVGSLIYYLTKYQHFRNQRLGGLTRSQARLAEE